MLELGLKALITSDPTLAGLIGPRCFPVFVPPTATFPCLSYQVVSGDSSYSLDGSAETMKRIQFDAWGKTYADCKAIQGALHALLDGFTGTLTDGTAVRGCFRQTEFDAFENNSLLYRSLTEYAFHFTE